MSVDIQKQLDLRPYSDKNVVTKPSVQPEAAPAAHIDEEKSNAAKWMIGLTATAAIAIGGLYLAKHGKLGDSAEKWAKKLLGEGVKETTSTASSTATSSTTTGAAALALITPAFVRGKIKNPKFKFNDLIQELEKSKISFEKTEATELIPKSKITALTENGSFTFKFDKDGVLKSIRKLTDNNDIVYKFDNNVLSGIKRKFTADNGKELQHILEFAENGKLKKQTYKFDLGDKNIHLESIENNTKLFRNADNLGSDGEYLVERLGKRFEELPEKIRGLKFKIQDRITSPQIEYLKSQPITTSLAKNVKSSEIVEAYLPRTSNFFNQAVNELEMARNAANRTLERYSVTVDDVLSPIRKASRNGEKLTRIPSENIEKALKLSIEDKKLAAPIARLIEQDMGSSKHISLHTLELLGKKYSEALKAYGIDKPEQLEVIAKPLNKCSKADLIKIIGNRDSVHKIFPGCFDDYGMLDVEFLSSKPGFSHVKEHMTIFDILKDIV